MWKDEGFGIQNKALLRLMPRNGKYTPGDQRAFYSPNSGNRISFDVTGEPVWYDGTAEYLGGIVVFRDVTECTKRIAAQIEENERLFEYIANFMHVMVWTTTPDGVHDWFPHGWYDYTGLTVEESLGEVRRLPFHEEDMTATAARWKHSLETGEEYNTEYRCRRHDGHIIKWFCTYTDIHDLVEARQEVRQTRVQWPRVIEHARVTLWAVNRHSELILLEGDLKWRDATGEMAIRQNLSVFGDMKERDKMQRWKRPIEHAWSIAEHIAQKENSRLLANAVAAKEASRMKSQFLAKGNVSRNTTPIAGVIGMSELLLDMSLDEGQKNCAENIQRSANGLLIVINDIINFSKAEPGRPDVEEYINKMISFAAQRMNLRDLRVMGDPRPLQQILANLLTNSIKFTSEGSVRLAVSITSETLEMVTVHFVVEDTGIVIEKDVRKRLFQPFSQAESLTARRFGGTGLGLIISKKSKLGPGTKATFLIPFNKAQYQDDGSPMIDLASIPDRLQIIPDHLMNVTKSARQKIPTLIVEDKKLYFSVNAVWNGQEALEYLLKEPTSTHPHGYSATHAIRTLAPFKDLPDIQNVPIVAMTASTIQGDKENDYLAEPVKGKVLEMIVKRAIEGRRMLAKQSVSGKEEDRRGTSAPSKENPGTTTRNLNDRQHIYQLPAKSETAAQYPALTAELDRLHLSKQRRLGQILRERCLTDDKLLSLTGSPRIHRHNNSHQGAAGGPPMR
ncbi:hypothetical protein K469DRAFT_725241 [Zopfia rhizophila CBS 207.26]|uniref:Histidine kinase domain-containing protein n=1 Tax=Zopfia rhizophila CBS 207.26 TaxID=1314779 RepID=A0A6A6E9R4_9PEZI|nr:hypothetical protein K469DRAFT_725241 [Zopfia rhizophila CBS 207.26]